MALDLGQIKPFDTPENEKQVHLHPAYAATQDQYAPLQRELREHKDNEEETESTHDENLHDNRSPFYLSYHHLSPQKPAAPPKSAQSKSHQHRNGAAAGMSKHYEAENGNLNDKSSEMDGKQSASCSPNRSSFHSSDASSVQSSQNEVSPAFNPHGVHARFNPHIHVNTNTYNARNGALVNSTGSRKAGMASHSHSRSSKQQDSLQRKLQKLEQDILSKNIQHDIMVNKEVMMSKRLKTKDIRIKNLQNDVNKLREQLTSKTESMEKLINEMQSIQSKNRGLSTKLRESAMGLNMSVNGSEEQDANQYNQSMRDILHQLQTNIHDLNQDIHEIKQAQLQIASNHDDGNESQMMHANMANNEQFVAMITNSIQSCLSPVVHQMKEQQNEFMSGLQHEQEQWMSNTREQLHSNQEVMESHHKSMAKKVEMTEKLQQQTMENHIGSMNRRLDDLVNHNKSKHKDMYQAMKKQEIKLDALNTPYFQKFFDAASKSQQQSQDIMLNQLKQELKGEIYAVKTELTAAIKKTHDELDSSINAMEQNVTHSNNEMKFQLQSVVNSMAENRAGSSDDRSDTINSDHLRQQQQYLVNQQTVEQYQRFIESRSDMIKANAAKLDDIQQTVNELKKENKNMVKSMQQSGHLQTLKLEQHSDESGNRITAAIEGLKPLFKQLYDLFQGQNNNLVDMVQQSNSDMIESFAKHKNEFQKIIKSTMSVDVFNVSGSGSGAAGKNEEYAQILKEMKCISEYLDGMKQEKPRPAKQDRVEYGEICQNMHQIAQSNIEIGRFITNQLPTTMDKLRSDSKRLGEMCNNLATAFKQIQAWYTSNPPQASTANQGNNNKQQQQTREAPSPQKHMYHSSGSEEKMVKSIKSMLLSQIEEMKKGFTAMDGKIQCGIKLELDRMLQQINTSNVKLYQNIKGVYDTSKQHIIDQCDSNHQKRIVSHESVLKNHLKEISKHLADLYQQSQVTVMALRNVPSIVDSPIPPLPTATSATSMEQKVQQTQQQQRESDRSSSSRDSNLQRIQQLIGSANQQMFHNVQQLIDSKLSEAMSKFGQMMSSRAPPPPPSMPPSDPNENGSSNHQEMLSAVKEMKQFVRNDISKELSRISNFVKDIHAKIEQLPHKMAYKKELQKLERSFNHLASAQKNKAAAQPPTPSMSLSPLLSSPIFANESRIAIKDGNNGYHVFDEFMAIIMVKFNEYLANVLGRLNVENCSVYTIVYVLSKIAFTTFIQSKPVKNGKHKARASGDHTEEEEEEEEDAQQREEEDSKNDDEKKRGHRNRDGEINANLSRIQMWALTELNRIETELENDELDLNRTVQNFLAWLQDVLGGGHGWKRIDDNIWMPRHGEGMEYVCNQEMRINERLSYLKSTMQSIMRNQSANCNKACILKVSSAVFAVFVVVTAILVAKVMTEDNPMW